jgi:hypothetical protein
MILLSSILVTHDQPESGNITWKIPQIKDLQVSIACHGE